VRIALVKAGHHECIQHCSLSVNTTICLLCFFLSGLPSCTNTSTMANILKPGTGSTVSYVTSLAQGHPGSDALAEDKKSFWVTTGIFPQEIVVRLSKKTPINTIKLLSVNGAACMAMSRRCGSLRHILVASVTPEKRCVFAQLMRFQWSAASETPHVISNKSSKLVSTSCMLPSECLARHIHCRAELPDDGLHLESIGAGGVEATFLKLKIHSGHGEFAAVYNISATAS